THDFVASAADATVSLEVRSRYALTQNAWYIASARLTPASGATTPASAVAPVVTAPTTPAPASTGAVAGPTGRRRILRAARLFAPDKLKYASQIENIKVYELITNTTSVEQKYGVIGVEIINRDTNEKIFHTSFSGDLKLGPNCQGPKDACGGEWLDQLRIDH